MKFRKSFVKRVSYLSIFGLVMSNMTYVLAEENKPQNPALLSEAAPKPSIFVTNSKDKQSSNSLSKDEIERFKEEGMKSIEAAAKKDKENKFANKENLSDFAVHKPDEEVSVIVQLKGETVSEMTASDNVGINQLSLSDAKDRVNNDIETQKTEIMNKLSGGKSKSSSKLQFKHEYENIFKGFSIDHIKYEDIDDIKSLPDVKSVTLQQIYAPAVNQQHDLTGIKNLWNGSTLGKPIGYKGEGMVIAIVDTGVDYTHEAFPDPTDMSKARIKKGKFIRPDGTTSLKVVDGYNWADQNDDIIPRVEDPNNATSSHGVHVAGIAAGSGPVIQGVAPEAQIIAEKVFSDHQAGALTEDIIKGIDHASSLGADVINMSLGSSSSFDTRDPNDPLGIAIRNATDEGHVVVVAAGNASNAYSDRSGGMGETIKLGQTPDLNKIGNPGVYPDSFTVAAANNFVSKHTYQFLNTGVGHSISGEGLDDWNWTANKDKEYVLVPLGKDIDGNDLPGLLTDYTTQLKNKVKNNIVLIKRGTISFAEKVANAKQAGAAGVIVYNSSPDSAAPDPQGFGTIPFSFISYEDGMALQEVLDQVPVFGGGIPTIKFKITDEKLGSAFAESNSGQPTDFTSWGTTSDLLLKPEVMAPGHAIVSSVRTADTSKHNAYESEDGTSMAAPYVTGAVADVMQALIDKGYKPGTRAFAQLTKNLIMNTSIPAKRDYVNANNSVDRIDYMTEYQPRRQGAGMIRPDLAVKSPVVVTGTTGTGSISLKEIGKSSTFTLVAQNLSNQAVTYKLNGNVMTDVLKDSLKTNSDNIRSRYLEDAKLSFDLNEITIPANSTKRVNVTLSLADSTLKNTFVEGYIYLTPTDSKQPTLNVPYNGFYGKWDEPNIVDTKETTDVWTKSGLGTQMGIQTGPFYFGYNEIFGEPHTPEQLALGDKYYAYGPGMNPLPALALLRNARNLKIDVVDKNHNLVTHLSDDEWLVKSDPYSGTPPVQISGDWIWNSTNQGITVQDGQYYFAVTATADAPNAKPQPTVYIPMYKDTTAPTLNMKRSADYDETSHPEVTNEDSYTVRWTMDDGDAGGVDGNVYLAVNGSEPYTNYREDVKQNDDGTYELKVYGLNEGLNIINIAPIDKVGNLGKEQTVIVNKTSNHVWIDLQTATLNDNVPSMYWAADVKPGDEFNLNFKAVGRKNVVKKIQAVILKNYYDNSTVVGEPVDLDLNQYMTETPLHGEYSEYAINGHFNVPNDLPAGDYAVKFVVLAEGEKWNDPDIPAVGIETAVDTVAPTISLNASNMSAYVENSGDHVALMLNTTVKDTVANSRGYKVEVAVDGGSKKSMGSIVTFDPTPKTFRYPVVLENGDHKIVLTTTDTLENTSTLTFDVTVATDKVTVKNDTTTTELPIKVVPYKDTSRNTEIKFLDIPRDGIYVSEGFDPGVHGYIVTPYGNNKTYSANPDLAPILLVGNQQRKADTPYYPNAIPSWDMPIGDVYAFNSLVGYNDPGSIPEGKSTFPVTMIDYLGHETTVQLPVYKNSYIPKVKFDDAIIDATGTATFFTYDSSFTVKGTVTAHQDKFYASWVDWNRGFSGLRDVYKNLFDEQSEWRDNVYDNPLTSTDIPAGYEQEPGVKPFSMNTGELKPGPNLFEIDGGSTIGSNPSHPLTGNHPLVFNVVVYRLGAAESPDQPLAINAANKLNWDLIKGENVQQTEVKSNLALPFVDESNKAHISWTSSDETVLTNEGKVYRANNDTDITLTATATVGGATSVKTFNVTVKAKTPDDSLAVDEDASFIKWDVIRAANTDQENVSQNLSLPTRGSNGSLITWTSDDTKHITNQGTVYPPLFDEEDAHVKLVAKITRNSGTTYKTFNLTVLKDNENADRTKVLRVYNSLEMKNVLGENSSDMEVTHDLSFPSTIGNDGVSITWLSDNPEIIANDGKVTIPEQNQYVQVTAIIRLGTAGLAKSFGFYVRSKDTNDEPAVQAAKASVVWKLIKKNNTDQNLVTSSLNLPTKGSNDTTIKWSSSDPFIINEDGTVRRPNSEKGNQKVTLTATISKGEAKITQEFNLTVLSLHTVDDNDKVISGLTEANASITVKNNDQVVGTGKAKEDGTYEVEINPQKAGTELTIIIEGQAGNQVIETTTVIDRTAPNAPKIDVIDDNDTTISGTAEANATILVKAQDKVIATGIANSEGKYAIQISLQTAGTTLHVTAQDSNGNESDISSIVVLDRTAPNAPKIDVIDDNDTAISGTAEANATILVKAQDKVIATGKANSEGKYVLLISPQKAGTELQVTAQDADGNQSDISSITILDRTAPNVLVVNSIDDNDTAFTGISEANATILIKVQGILIGTGKANSEGKFVVHISPQKAGTVLQVTAQDADGNQLNVSITVVDGTAPTAPKIDAIDDNDTKITGTAEANATIFIKVQDKVIATGKADAQGKYAVVISPQKARTVLQVIAQDSSGFQSVTTSIIVLDRTAPNVPKINVIDDNDKTISGTAEANATILIKVQDKLIASGKANSDGKYVVQISPQRAGTTLRVTAQDSDGNQSEITTIVVIDKTAPTAPKINVIDDNDTYVTGTTEANASIKVIVQNKVIATGKADTKGIYRIKVSKQKAGTALTVVAIDQAGNQSASSKTTVLDRTAPTAPVISRLVASTKNEITIEGKAEAYTSIIVSVGNKIVGKANVTSKGTFGLKLPKQAKGTLTLTLTIYAVDKAGNKSSSVKRTIKLK
ncbi:Ig-like domain-containing protein [Bacillus sp. AFS088145]|uniref:Ig-like domain-containing protein n=1 Tax=Bacillus sp. AFS088145 TaxID=2033514 RepID=UPI0015CF095B|nr:Ig-like domain-containing protein [Bacillus sp. AFS088145]